MADAGLLCVHAHPDDEAISTGGVLAAAADAGRRATVVTCTGGEHGEIVGDGVDPDLTPGQLREVRADELRAALDVLGVDPPVLLGYADSGMMGTTTNDADGAFWRAPFDEAVGRLVTHLRRLRPAVVVSYDAYGLYGHPDHIQAHRVTVAAVPAAASASLYPDAGEPWQVPKAYFSTIPRSAVAELDGRLRSSGLASPFAGDVTVGTPDERITATVDVSVWLDRKWDALRAHRSQLGPDSFFLNMPGPLRERAFGTEWFERWWCRVEAPAREHDLFAGI